MALSSPKTIVTRPAETVEIADVQIVQVLDNTETKEVTVWIKGIGSPILLGGLSGEFYNNPPWTDELVQQHTEAFIEGLN